MFRPAILLTCLTVLGACSALGALNSATDVLAAYEVRNTGTIPTAAGGPLARDLIVETPTSGGALDTERILIRPDPLSVQYLPGVRWTDTVPVMMQTVLVRGLQQSGGVRFVGRRPIGLGGDFALLTEITDFQAEVAPETGAVTTRVRLVTSMVRESDAAVVATRVFDVQGVSASTEVQDVVAALDASMAQLMPQLVRWAMGAVGARVS